MASREKHLTRLVSSAGIVTLGKLLGSATTLGERIVIGRLLDPGAYGEVSIGIALLSFATTFGMLGYSQGVPRYVSRFDSERDVRGVWVTGMLVTGSIALLVAAALYLNVDLLTATLLERADSTRMLSLFVLALPLVVGMNVCVGTIRGFGNTVYKAYAQDLAYPLTRIALIGGLLWIGLDVVAAGYAYLAGAAVGFALSLYLLHRLMTLPGEYRTHVVTISKFSLPIVVSSALGVLLTRTDTIMLGYFRGSQEVGHYSAAYPLAGAILVVISSFGFLYLPLASRLDADGEREEMAYIYETTTKWIYLASFPVVLTFALFADDVIAIFFGSDYTAGALALTILTLGFYTHAIGGRNRETISAIGVTKYLLVVNGVAFGLNIVLNLVLIPRYGLNGAAVASAVSYAGLNVTACAILKVGYDITPVSRWSLRTFVALPLTLVAPTYLVSQYVSLTTVTLVPFVVLVGLAAVAVAALAGCLQPEDEVLVEFVEKGLGVRMPFIRRFLPDSDDRLRP